ncbi:hypothetical protein [Endozoicomonas sp. SCSIO W0465]|uniref:hypothetical protein n=1 Tax=Endozoicomonas sp. SCSIO W0465 TaxID=2918516 RepID=UPI002074C78E|nr:hypothetical protein [Endozoicomonas sp. SCSIO W0465]USE36482.1 hypothetical protein MJO57_31460 [Endozoicomonas sp. SCSIO W0465]
MLLSLLVPLTCIWADDSWVEIGSAKARVSENTLMIFPRTEDAYSKLRFHIVHGDIILHQAHIYLNKGDVFNVNLQKTIKGKKNGDDGQDYSRAIPLTVSQQSPIKKIKVFYKFKKQQVASRPVTIELLGVPAN